MYHNYFFPLSGTTNIDNNNNHHPHQQHLQSGSIPQTFLWITSRKLLSNYYERDFMVGNVVKFDDINKKFSSSSSSPSLSLSLTSSWNESFSSLLSNDAKQLISNETPMATDDFVSAQSTEWEDPLWTAIPMTVLYILILVTGVIGNVLTCVVIVRNRNMHTATNYYLFSLAISDLLLLVLGLPQEIYQIWHRPYTFGEVFCILRGFSSEASTNSSMLTITAFTMERYIAICHPLRAHTMSKLSRAIKLIVIIWLLGFLCAAPIAYQFGIVYELEDEVPIPLCNIKRPFPYLEGHIFALQSLIVFVLPVTWISVLYTLIGIELRQSSQTTQPDMNRLRRRPIKRHQRSKNSFTSELADQSQPLQKRQGSLMDNNSDKDSFPVANIANNSTSNQCHPQQQKHEAKSKESPGVKSSLQHQSYEPQEQQQQQESLSHTPALPSCSSKKYRRKFSSKLKSSNTGASGSNSLAHRRAVIKMLTAVVVAFFVCFAPFHAQRLMAIYVEKSSDYQTSFTLLTYISGVTYYLSATINPILYSIMSIRFRQAFHDTFVRTFCSSYSVHFDHHRADRRLGRGSEACSLKSIPNTSQKFVSKYCSSNKLQKNMNTNNTNNNSSKTNYNRNGSQKNNIQQPQQQSIKNREHPIQFGQNNSDNKIANNQIKKNSCQNLNSSDNYETHTFIIPDDSQNEDLLEKNYDPTDQN